jgi:hypothetical protein
MALGAPGVLELPYHLHGTVTIDWGDNVVEGVHVGGAKASLVWGYIGFSNGMPTVDANLENESWSGNHLSVVVDRDVVARVPFHVGQIFYFDNSAKLMVSGDSPVAPAVGFVEADFLHTATLGPAIVLDKFGNPLSNPVIESDSGFDFAHPQVPEPSSALLLAATLTGLAACRKATSGAFTHGLSTVSEHDVRTGAHDRRHAQQRALAERAARRHRIRTLFTA